MRIYLHKNIYFNVVVSQYFNVPYSNSGEKTNLIASTILGCPIVSWDIDTRKTLTELGDQEITLLGRGSGEWEIFVDQVVQNKPNTEIWNNPQEDDDPQKDNGRSASRNLDEFIKNLVLFI